MTSSARVSMYPQHCVTDGRCFWRNCDLSILNFGPFSDKIPGIQQAVYAGLRYSAFVCKPLCITESSYSARREEEETTASRSSRPGIEVYHLPQGYHRQVEWGYKSV